MTPPVGIDIAGGFPTPPILIVPIILPHDPLRETFQNRSKIAHPPRLDIVLRRPGAAGPRCIFSAISSTVRTAPGHSAPREPPQAPSSNSVSRSQADHKFRCQLVSVLLINAVAILSEDRFLARSTSPPFRSTLSVLPSTSLIGKEKAQGRYGPILTGQEEEAERRKTKKQKEKMTDRALPHSQPLTFVVRSRLRPERRRERQVQDHQPDRQRPDADEESVFSTPPHRRTAQGRYANPVCSLVQYL